MIGLRWDHTEFTIRPCWSHGEATMRPCWTNDAATIRQSWSHNFAVMSSSGDSRILCWGANGAGIFVWGAKGRLSAEGAKLRLPKARSPSRLGGLGRVVSSQTDAIFNISSQNGEHFGILLISHFKQLKFSYLKMWDKNFFQTLFGRLK